jgi:hypothetical protein
MTLFCLALQYSNFGIGVEEAASFTSDLVLVATVNKDSDKESWTLGAFGDMWAKSSRDNQRQVHGEHVPCTRGMCCMYRFFLCLCA